MVLGDCGEDRPYQDYGNMKIKKNLERSRRLDHSLYKLRHIVTYSS